MGPVLGRASIGRCCEVGAGRSSVLELLNRLGRDLGSSDRLLLVDSSRRMLQHTADLGVGGETSLLAVADELPIRPRSFDTAVISLGDPFNTQYFWSELSRVVRVGGQVAFTSPSVEWSEGFRQDEHSPSNVARFILRDGTVIDSPSFIYAAEAQVKIMESSGFRTLDRAEFPVSQLSGNVSRKLMGVETAVVGFLAQRAV